MQAVGAYLKRLREHRRLSRAVLASQIGASEMSIWRIEEKGLMPSVPLLMGLVRALDASWSTVDELMHNEAATVEDGYSAADAHDQRSEVRRELDRLTDEEWELFARLVSRLLHRPA